MGTYKTAEILLEPAAAPESTKTAAPGGVLLTREGDSRVVRSDLYEAAVDGDGCLPSLRVDGVEFLKPGVSISRGAYFHQSETADGCPTSCSRSRPSYWASGKTACGFAYDFGPDKMTWTLENKTDCADGVLHRVRPRGDGGAERQGRMGEDAGRQAERSTGPEMGQDDLVRRPRQDHHHGRHEGLGAVADAKGYQVWEASLAPQEKRTVVDRNRR